MGRLLGMLLLAAATEEVIASTRRSTESKVSFSRAGGKVRCVNTEEKRLAKDGYRAERAAPEEQRKRVLSQ